MNTASRSESVLVRPFAGIADADPPLEVARFVVDGQEHENGAIVLPDEVLASAQFSVLLPSPDSLRSAIERTVVDGVDCGLVVMATARSHRVSSVLLQKYLRSDWPESLLLNRMESDLIFNDRAGFVVTVAVVLFHDLSPEPLRPNMAGTWLARREFKISPEVEENSFSPEELTDEIREHYGLPKGVLRYVDVDGVLQADMLSDAVHVYLDPEVLHLLLANPLDPLSVQIQTELAIQATEVVAAAIAAELGSEAPATVASLDAYPAAQRFYVNLANSLGLSLADVLDLATNRSPVLRANLEAAFEMRVATSSALKEK